MNFNLLRARLIEKAIQGKLVPQLDSEPEVEQIGEAPEEVPFEIPSKWKWVQLKSLTVKRSTIEPLTLKEKQVELWSIPAYDTGFCEICSPQKIGSSKKEVFNGDVLLAKIVPHIRRVWVVSEDKRGLKKLASTEWLVYESKFFDPLLLSSWLHSPYFNTLIMQTISGMGSLKRANPKRVNEIWLPLPPLEEQKRIVEKLNQSLNSIDRAEKAYEELQKLSKVLKDKVLEAAIQGKLVPQLDSEPEVEQIGEAPEEVPFDIPSKWKWVRLENVGDWKSGSTPSRSEKEFFDQGTIPWLKTGDLTDGFIEKTEEKITQYAVNNCSLRVNPIGSVLIAMYGATIGKLGIVKVPCTTNQACCACIPKSNLILSEYLFYYLFSQKQKFISMGAGGAQPNISKKKIISYVIPLPPLEEQKRIVEKLNELMKLQSSLQGQH